MKSAKNLAWLLVVVPILALIIVLACHQPALDWVAMVFEFIANLFTKVGKACRWLQQLISQGIIK